MGDAKNVLTELEKQVCRDMKAKKKSADRSEWLERMPEIKKQCPLTYDKDSEKIKPGFVIETI